jgi:hypothetical protein
LLKDLPTLGYELIIIRVHSGPLIKVLPNGTKTASNDIVIFTNERYESSKYLDDQLDGRIVKGVLENEGAFFAVTPSFVRAIQARFNNTTVILEACYGFRGTSMLEALRSRGVGTIAGWDGEVSVSYADEVVINIVDKVYGRGATLQQAVEACRKDMGRDPYYGSELRVFP